MPTISVRISEGMKAEIESLVSDTGLWKTQTEFIVEALDENIKRHWMGERYGQG